MITNGCANQIRRSALIFALSFILAVPSLTASVAADGTLHAKDLIEVTRALLGKAPEAKKYLGRRFEADAKYRSGPVQGANSAEIEFADIAGVGRLPGIDEVHVLCDYPLGDPALKALNDIVAHSAPILQLSGTVVGVDRSDSEGKIVAFVKLNNCTAVKKGF